MEREKVWSWSELQTYRRCIEGTMSTDMFTALVTTAQHLPALLASNSIPLQNVQYQLNKDEKRLKCTTFILRSKEIPGSVIISATEFRYIRNGDALVDLLNDLLLHNERC